MCPGCPSFLKRASALKGIAPSRLHVYHTLQSQSVSPGLVQSSPVKSLEHSVSNMGARAPWSCAYTAVSASSTVRACCTYRKLLPASDGIPVALDLVALVGTPFVTTASQKSELSTSEWMDMEPLPASDVVPVACNPVALVSAPFAISTSLQSNGTTTTIGQVYLEFLPASDVVSVAFHIAALVSAILAISATIQTECQAPIHVVNRMA